MVDLHLLSFKIEHSVENPNFYIQIVQTHENAIYREENGQFIVWIQQKSASENIPSAFPCWFNGTCWPFNVMDVSGHPATMSTILNNPQNWSIANR
jgi:hypothetical protein